MILSVMIRCILTCCSGNQFCGEIADEYQGVVRNFTGNYGPFQVLADVTSFDTNCAIDVSRPAHVGTHNGIAGMLSFFSHGKPRQTMTDASFVHGQHADFPKDVELNDHKLSTVTRAITRACAFLMS